MAIEQLVEEDKTFLEQFTGLEELAMNHTGLRSLANFPKNETLSRLELCENKLGGDELKNLQIYSGSLHTLKLTSNKFTTLAQLDQLVRKIVDSTFSPKCFVERHECTKEH